MTETNTRRPVKIPGHYDWIICQTCGAKHGYPVDFCKACYRKMQPATKRKAKPR